jgi:hypothetical protein
MGPNFNPAGSGSSFSPEQFDVASADPSANGGGGCTQGDETMDFGGEEANFGGEETNFSISPETLTIIDEWRASLGDTSTNFGGPGQGNSDFTFNNNGEGSFSNSSSSDMA